MLQADANMDKDQETGWQFDLGMSRPKSTASERRPAGADMPHKSESEPGIEADPTQGTTADAELADAAEAIVAATDAARVAEPELDDEMPLLAVARAPTVPIVPSGQPGRLTLVRHGRPNLSRKVKLDWRGFDDWWSSYDLSGLEPGQAIPHELADLARGVPLIVSSTLARAIETAEALADGRSFEQDRIFVEAPLPAPPFPYLKVGPSTWGVLSRVAWLFGFAGGKEGHGVARRRAEAAADRLVELSARGDVMLCAHGWFNLMLAQILKKRGWVRVRNGGSAYWSWSIFEPPKETVAMPAPSFKEKLRVKFAPAYSRR